MDPLDELAAMFLTASDAPAGGATRVAASIELLLVGHLPVRAGLWLTPYADAVAADRGPVALVRLDAGEPMLQLLGARGASTDEPPRNLRESILQLAGVVRTWIVRPSSRASVGEVLEHGFGAGTADRVTILSGSNDAAVVNAYKLIKELAATAQAAGQRMPEMGLAVLGSERREAMRAADHLNHTTRKYLRLEVPLVLCLPRMDGRISGSSLRTFPGQSRPELDEVIAWIEDGRSRAAAAAEPPRSGARPAETLPSREPARHSPEPWPADPVLESAPPREHEPTPTNETAGATPAAPNAARVERSLEPDVGPAAPAAVPPSISTSPGPGVDPFRGAEAPESPASPDMRPFPDPLDGAVRTETIRFAASEVEAKDPARPFEPDQSGRPVPLARYVPDEGADPTTLPTSDGSSLVTIPPRCPGHERVELAVDRKGRLHLLGFEDTLREMPVVEAWARAHREILAMACPDHRIDPGGRVVRHLFTDAPMKVADLHGSDFRLHVLATVRVGDRAGWYAARLA